MSYEFFIAAALLALFGAAALNNQGSHGTLQVLLAVLMGGAGMFLRTGTAEARVIGLAAAAVTVAVGGYALVFQNDYFVGTIIAVFAIFRLWSVGTPVLVQTPMSPPTGPMSAFDAAGPFGGGFIPAQPTAAPAPAPSTPAPSTPAPYTQAYSPAPYSPAPYFPAPVQRPDDLV